MGKKVKNKHSKKSREPRIKNLLEKIKNIWRVLYFNPSEIWDSLYGLVVSMLGGLYIGFNSRSYRESWIYSFILMTLSLVCIIGSKLSKKNGTKQVFSNFILYFLMAGLTSPVATWIAFSLF